MAHPGYAKDEIEVSRRTMACILPKQLRPDGEGRGDQEARLDVESDTDSGVGVEEELDLSGDEEARPASTSSTRTDSSFFKRLCPDAYSYAKDDQTSTFTCPQGSNYDIVLCP